MKECLPTLEAIFGAEETSKMQEGRGKMTLSCQVMMSIFFQAQSLHLLQGSSGGLQQEGVEVRNVNGSLAPSVHLKLTPQFEIAWKVTEAKEVEN